MLQRIYSIVAVVAILLGLRVSSTAAQIYSDDFSGGLNLPWVFIDDFGDSPPAFTEIISNDADQDLKFIGSAEQFEQFFDLSLSTTGYVGLGDPDFAFQNEVHVTATFSPLTNISLGLDEGILGDNDVYVVARGTGLNGYIFALDAFNAEADLVRVDDGAIVGLGDSAILRDLPGIEQDGSYTLRLSALDDVLNGQVFAANMNLIGEVFVQDDTYSSGWAGLGAAINDGGDGFSETLIATRFDNFSAADTLDINVDPPSIDELTSAVNNGLTDARYDIDGNGTVDAEDRVAWVTVLANTYFGDANLDGEFNSNDFVAVFTAGEYEDAIAGNSLWADGDWNGDGDFSSGDFVLAFSGGGYESGPRVAQMVPEPASLSLVALGVLVFFGIRIRRLQEG